MELSSELPNDCRFQRTHTFEALFSPLISKVVQSSEHLKNKILKYYVINILSGCVSRAALLIF